MLFICTLNHLTLFMKKSDCEIFRVFLLSAIFSIAMGVLEAIVVIYIRMVYYPAGFSFPLKFLTPEMMQVEWIREISTVIMLAVVGILSGKDNLSRFLYFLYSFAVWDITYYATLKIFLDWPANLLVWDILFLIPLPWLGPVLAPVICSALMLFMTVSFMYMKKVVRDFRVYPREWVFILTGATLVILSYTQDFMTLIFQNEFNLYENSDFWKTASLYVPEKFNWLTFSTGIVLILMSIIFSLYQYRKK